MITLNGSCGAVVDQSTLHATFIKFLPRLERHAQIYFRHLRCPHQLAEAIAEVVAVAWKWFLRLVERGKDVAAFPSTFATLVARAVKSGRRAVGKEKARDVMSPVAQQQYHFKVQSLASSPRRSFQGIRSVVGGQQAADAYEDRLKENGVTPPPDAAAFRLDFPKFLLGLSYRDRELAMYLSLGHSATKAAKQFGLTPGRITQLRQRWRQEWRQGQGELDYLANGGSTAMAVA